MDYQHNNDDSKNALDDQSKMFRRENLYRLLEHKQNAPTFKTGDVMKKHAMDLQKRFDKKSHQEEDITSIAESLKTDVKTILDALKDSKLVNLVESSFEKDKEETEIANYEKDDHAERFIDKNDFTPAELDTLSGYFGLTKQEVVDMKREFDNLDKQTNSDNQATKKEKPFNQKKPHRSLFESIKIFFTDLF
ncbi:MAG: hypothetical protein K9L74_07545 [Candidatus Izimaplasma sp.]|nr:hypothetical protein [Candidatus Izimaplasma bacterium]